MHKLSDFLEGQEKSKIKAGDSLNYGKYKFFTSSPKQSKFCNNFDYEGPALIFGTGGLPSVHYCEEQFSTSTDCIVFYGQNKNILKYIYYYLFNNIHILAAGFKGAGLQHISKDFILNIEFELPANYECINMQADALNCIIHQCDLRLSYYDELVKSRFIELFGATSAENCTKQIKDYAEVLGGYAFKSDLFCADAIPVIRISNINNGCVELDYNICFDELFWEQNKRFRVEQNDVLMAMSGATTGKAGIYRENMPALINQRVACIRAKDGVACPTFLFVATQLEWMYDLIQETSAGCAQPNISGKQIENMPVPDASYEQQQQFASFVEQTDKSKLAITGKLTYYKELVSKLFE